MTILEFFKYRKYQVIHFGGFVVLRRPDQTLTLDVVGNEPVDERVGKSVTYK